MVISINGYEWLVIFVDMGSSELIDRTGRMTLATTDPKTRVVYICNAISGELLERVVKHEVAHCIMASYGLVSEIHKMTKRRYWIEAEEWVCNFIADFNDLTTNLCREIIKYK